MAQPQPHRFDDPSWSLADAFGWVLDRDPAKFGRLRTATAWGAATSGFYDGVPSSERALQAAKVLLHAVQRGELIAIDGKGNRVSPDDWLAVTIDALSGLRHRGFVFRREHVLRLWPADDERLAAGPADRTSAPIGYGYRTNREASAEEACASWFSGLDRAPGNKDATFAAARAAVDYIGPLSRKAFDRAWARSAPSNWRRPGRRRKNPRG